MGSFFCVLLEFFDVGLNSYCFVFVFSLFFVFSCLCGGWGVFVEGVLGCEEDEGYGLSLRDLSFSFYV